MRVAAARRYRKVRLCSLLLIIAAIGVIGAAAGYGYIVQGGDGWYGWDSNIGPLYIPRVGPPRLVEVSPLLPVQRECVSAQCEDGYYPVPVYQGCATASCEGDDYPRAGYPRCYAGPCGRTLFPGSWGRLGNTNSANVDIDVDIIQR